MTLSDKIVEKTALQLGWLDAIDVKEFIKKLKERIKEKDFLSLYDIDELAGKELVE